MRRISVVLLVLVVLAGCATTGRPAGPDYRDAGIRLASHPDQVDGLTLVDSQVFQAGWIYSVREVHVRVANAQAARGLRNATILLEVLEAPDYGDSAGTYRATIYR